MDGRSKAGRWRLSLRDALSINDRQTLIANDLKGGLLSIPFALAGRRAGPGPRYVCLASVGSGFGGGVHAVLGNFVDAAGGGLNALAIEMIERDAALAHRIALFDSFRDVSLGQRGRFEQC